MTVKIELDAAWQPLHTIRVEFLCQRGGVHDGVARSVVGVRATAVEGSVDRAGRRGRLLPQILRDVDLAALGPAHLIDVIAQRPECRPQSPSDGHPQPSFEGAVPEGVAVLGADSGRGVIPGDGVHAPEPLRTGDDPETTTSVLVGIGLPGRVGLQLTLAPGAAGLVAPTTAVHWRIRGTIELIGPDQAR